MITHQFDFAEFMEALATAQQPDKAAKVMVNFPDRFQTLVAAYNNTPRKCLDWMTPAETFSQVLHFECESTSPLPRGRAAITDSIRANPTLNVVRRNTARRSPSASNR